MAAKGEGAWVGDIPSQSVGAICHSNIVDKVYFVFHGSEAYAIHLFSILMKKFIKSVLLVLCVSLVIDVVLDCCVTRFLNKSQAYPYKLWNDIIHDTIDADLLVLGNSRAKNQYDPHIMDSMLSLNSYNLGLDASPVNRQIVRYKVYRHYQKKKPSYLIVNLDYYGNWKTSRYRREQYFPYVFKPYMRKLIRNQEHFGLSELYIPMFRYYSYGILSLLKSGNGKMKNYKGYNFRHSAKWDGKKLKEIEIIDFDPLQRSVEEFDSFMLELKRDSVKVIFVCSPIYSGFTERAVNLSEFYEFRKHFSDKYDIPVLDYFYDPICADTNYFSNAMHLNKTGAELFTTKLCHDLDSLGLLE